MSSQYGELRPISGRHRFGCSGHPTYCQRVSRLGSVTARHSSSRRQPNLAALNRGRHLYSAGRPSRWALFHILVLFFLAYSQPSQIECLPYFYTWCGLSANLECRSEMCCTRLAGNAGPKKSPKNSPSGHHRTTLSAISSQLRHISTIGKNVKQQYLPTCPCNMANFGLLAAEIVWLVWAPQPNFNGFLVLAALLHGTLVVGVRQTLRH